MINFAVAGIAAAGGAVLGAAGALVVVPLVAGKAPTFNGVVSMTVGGAVAGFVCGVTFGLAAPAAVAAFGDTVAVAAGVSGGTGAGGGAAGLPAQQMTE